ncbi:YlmC/YmxH family sporulation protein [Alicyclobacillus cycloheptanicus]|uniref:YlmC/YmxH family sporulation protein n=1 Tax=Alicyclobacillus cycloheptanicus TaxID=1457 RepID=A0ABT9XL85_9BACL|nr:YlmC/YmxH family sporulation protein [Alicyclobacillus cycloheptanicus]MDQ0190982.1 YlmC/YmxH family sporulation protein [Alicyclobacillus cycloheptanicus]WDM01490.1 YlmC/YmxH family sporulation protein [Alicyclobacillus cycloheptanicus]
MRISDLQSKDVVNIGDGKRLGSIGDLEIDTDSGLIRALVVPGQGRFFGMVGGGHDYVIPWHQIVKIGSDVILVDLRPVQDTGYYIPPQSGKKGTGGY